MMSLPWLYLAPLIFIGVFLAATVATGIVARELRRRLILDRPNERSSHTVPTPRGGGWGVAPVVLAAWAATAIAVPIQGLGIVSATAAVLALVCWWDDLADLPVLARLAAQILAVAAGTAALPADAPVFQGLLPPALDRLAAAGLWLWFVNLFNFMDGIDGITGAELIAIGTGLALVLGLAGGAPGLTACALALAAGGLGFLVWNWHPAKVFLGDVGSVTLGYMTGWLLLAAAGAGAWLPALILPLYYLADATYTLIRRLLRGERIWRPHREHFYQKAVQRGLSHAQVVRRIAAANLLLVGCAAAGLAVGAVSLLPAGVAVALLLVHLASARPAGPR